jgi:hypothetical protein
MLVFDHTIPMYVVSEENCISLFQDDRLSQRYYSPRNKFCTFQPTGLFISGFLF